MALRALGVFRGITESLASCGVRSKSPIALKLLAWIRYVLGDSGNEVEHVPASFATKRAPKFSRQYCCIDRLTTVVQSDFCITQRFTFLKMAEFSENRSAPWAVDNTFTVRLDNLFTRAAIAPCGISQCA